VDFVQENNIGATITPHHLHINRNAMFFGGLNSDFYCLPVAKRENNRLALRERQQVAKNVFSWELTLLHTLGSGRLFVDVRAFLIRQ